MKPSYARWRHRLEYTKAKIKPKDWPVVTEVQAAGSTPTDGATPLDCGFYRKPIKEKQPNGRWKLLGYEPVALFVDRDKDAGNELACLIGYEAFVGPAIDRHFLWFVSHPISEDEYRATFAKGEPWQWDDLPQDVIPAADRQVTPADNADVTKPEQPLDVQHATAIDAAIGAALKKVTSEAEAAQALGSKNRIAELRLAADKAGKAIYEPIYRQYTAEQKKWSPIVKRAEVEEKRLNTEILSFRERERQRIAAEKAEADRRQQEHDEANARAADRAIARGEPEPEPIVEPELLVASRPEPIVPTYGTRGLQERLKKFVVIDDIAAVFMQFKADPQIVERLTKLAQAEIDAGRNVPGTHVREGLI